MKIHNFLGRWC